MLGGMPYPLPYLLGRPNEKVSIITTRSPRQIAVTPPDACGLRVKSFLLIENQRRPSEKNAAKMPPPSLHQGRWLFARLIMTMRVQAKTKAEPNTASPRAILWKG